MNRRRFDGILESPPRKKGVLCEVCGRPIRGVIKVLHRHPLVVWGESSEARHVRGPVRCGGHRHIHVVNAGEFFRGPQRYGDVEIDSPLLDEMTRGYSLFIHGEERHVKRAWAAFRPTSSFVKADQKERFREYRLLRVAAAALGHPVNLRGRWRSEDIEHVSYLAYDSYRKHPLPKFRILGVTVNRFENFTTDIVARAGGRRMFKHLLKKHSLGPTAWSNIPSPEGDIRSLTRFYEDLLAHDGSKTTESRGSRWDNLMR